MKLYQIYYQGLDETGQRTEKVFPFESDQESFWTAQEFFENTDNYVFPEDSERELIDLDISVENCSNERFVTITATFGDNSESTEEYFTNLPRIGN